MKADVPSRNNKAVVLLSGGIDSSTVLAIARAEGYELYAMSFDYQQRHRRELLSAQMVAEALGVKKHLVVAFNLGDIGGSALTAGIEVPKAESEKGTAKEIPSSLSSREESGIPVTYVPARNTIFLSFGLGWAEVLGAEEIFIGANAVDYSGYPDCRPAYLDAYEQMANLATKASVEGRLTFHINAPLIAMKKSEIIRKGLELGLDYGLTWSCYDPQPKTARIDMGADRGPLSVSLHGNRDHTPCRACDSCLFREKGFRDAGIADPLLSIVNG